MIDSDTPRAACLTPPAMGGVAVVQVVGRTAARIVKPLLRSAHPIDLETMNPEEIRLCRWVDDDQTIDDALVAVRKSTDGRFIIDISLHGGPRIVQRSLLMLQRAGARIVEPLELLDWSCPAASSLERAILPLLLEAKTRAVAIWLAQSAGRLEKRVQGLVGLLAADKIDLARQDLANLSEAAVPAGKLIRGVRVVVVGGPNVGKSTLINSLAVREQAIVSELEGTTRDWVEHPAAIDGAPFTFVDTAGIRETEDPIEQEAVRRTYQQASTADILLTVCDLTMPAEKATAVSLHLRRAQVTDNRAYPVVAVANKSDLPQHISWRDVLARGAGPLQVSAASMAGLDNLRARLIEAAGLTGWRQSLIAPLTERQQDTCQAALSALDAGRDRRAEAEGCLRNLLDSDPGP